MSGLARRAGIALGSNLGDRLGNLQKARDLLWKSGVEPFLQSKAYQTAPVGCPEGSPDFLNAVVEFGYNSTPDELLKTAMEIEKQMGRDRTAGTNAPRTIDVDLLYLGDTVCDTPGLTLPHPRLHQRRFVLLPLSEVNPELVLPGAEPNIAKMLNSLDSDEPFPQVAYENW